jgi:hypothetical protein
MAQIARTDVLHQRVEVWYHFEQVFGKSDVEVGVNFDITLPIFRQFLC